MKKQVVFIILDQYADWEYCFLAVALQDKILDMVSPYEVKTLSTRTPVKSIGGFTTIPDYTVDEFPADCAGIVLIGSKSWRTEEAEEIASIVKLASEKGLVIGAICGGTEFLGMHGFLNEKKHTSNTLEGLKEAAGVAYTNSGKYVHEQAVRDLNLVTANGTAYLEFSREMLLALGAYPAAYIEGNYQFYKQGYIEFSKNMR